MAPHVDSLSPTHGASPLWIEIKGSGFAPTATIHVLSVTFASAVESTVISAFFVHVSENGVIRDDRLRAALPHHLLPGGAFVTVEAIEILPPANVAAPKPGEVPSDPPEPRSNLLRSNSVFFLVECEDPYQRLTPTLMPPEVPDRVEHGILDFQNELMGGSFPIPGVENVEESWQCWGFRTKHLHGTIAFDSVTTAWKDATWTVTLTGRLHIAAKLDAKSHHTLCQWIRIGSITADGGGHQWTFKAIPCAEPCGPDLPDGERTFELHYVDSSFHMGAFNFNGVPD